MRGMAAAFAAILLLQSGGASADTIRAAIDAANAKFVAAFNAGDAAGVAALYTMDAALLPPEESRVDGRTAIGTYWQGAIDAGITDLDLKAVEVLEAGDTAAEIGHWAMSIPAEDEGEEQVSVSGKYIVLWHHDQDGAWRVYRDIWNDDPETGQ